MATTKKQPKKKSKKRATVKKSTAKKRTASQGAAKKSAAGKGQKTKRAVLLITSILVIAGLILTAVFVHGSAEQKRAITALKDTSWGIDVSSHNGKIDWKRVAAKADFAFIRVGYRGYSDGKIHPDKRAKANMKGANHHNLPIGVYFYSQAINEKEAVEEAQFLLSKIKDYRITLPVVIDFEYPYKDDKRVGRLHEAALNKKEKTALVNAFCDTVRKAGYTPGIYASSYIYRGHFNMKSIPKDVFIWVADYNKSVTYKGAYDIWQYSESGTCDGVHSKQVDLDYFYIKNRQLG